MYKQDGQEHWFGLLKYEHNWVLMVGWLAVLLGKRKLLEARNLVEARKGRIQAELSEAQNSVKISDIHYFKSYT